MADMIPFIDLASQRARIRDRLEPAMSKVIEEGRYILGPEVQELEERLAAFSGAPLALACANGTDAIALPLMAWQIRRGDAVFVPSFTFASTAEVVRWVGATPIFVDVDPDTYTMDIDHLEACMAMVDETEGLTARAVIAVDMFGQPADYRRIRKLCDARGLKLVADSAQGFGCTLDGQHPIHWADVATISFYPAKPLGCYGDGGAIVLKDPDLYALLRSLHVHGTGTERYEYARIGLNSRLDTLQAAVLLVKLDIFADEIVARNRAADAYAAGFGDLVQPHKVIEGGVSTWAQYTIQVPDRDGFRKTLADHGIPTAIYYPWPLHSQPAYSGSPDSPGGLPATDRIAERVVSLPMDAYLDGERSERVIAAVRAALG